MARESVSQTKQGSSVYEVATVHSEITNKNSSIEERSDEFSTLALKIFAIDSPMNQGMNFMI